MLPPRASLISSFVDPGEPRPGIAIWAAVLSREKEDPLHEAVKCWLLGPLKRIKAGHMVK